LQQEGYLCAQHCLNALLQGPYFNAVDLANFGHQMDEEERIRMAESGVDSEDYKLFLEVNKISQTLRLYVYRTTYY
jgi:ataxin-3